MADEIPLDKLVKGFVQNESSKDAEARRKRGRRYSGVDTSVLKERFIELQRQFFSFDRTNETERRDIVAELELRNEQLPLDVVRAEMDAFMETVRQGLEHQELHDPERYDEMGRELIDDLEAFRRQLKKPSV